MQFPPIQGVRIPRHYKLADRVKWYAVWVQSHPHQTLHFFHEALQSGFLSEPGNDTGINGQLVVTRRRIRHEVV